MALTRPSARSITGTRAASSSMNNIEFIAISPATAPNTPSSPERPVIRCPAPSIRWRTTEKATLTQADPASRARQRRRRRPRGWAGARCAARESGRGEVIPVHPCGESVEKLLKDP